MTIGTNTVDRVSNLTVQRDLTFLGTTYHPRVIKVVVRADFEKRRLDDGHS